MASKRTYLEQASDYYREQRWHQRLLAARVPRSLAIRAGTLAALGGASVLSQILAACAGGGAQQETTVGTSAEGSYKYSKFPYIEKYNWRNLPWGGTPYVDGTLVMSGSGANNWDMVRQPSGVLTSYGSVMDNLLNKRYVTAGYNFLRQNPWTGEFILANGSPGMSSTLGTEGILTAYYGNPRQVFVSLGANF